MDQTTQTTQSLFDYNDVMNWIENKGKYVYGPGFRLHSEDATVLRQLICYFLRDTTVAAELGISLNKGILLSGPVGCGKTSLMYLLSFLTDSKSRHIMKSCRDISLEFIRDGHEVIHRYSTRNFQHSRPGTICFDDLGIENSLKYYGNPCNVMAEILLSRYDLFIRRGMITHITTNLGATDIESAYGIRIRSRLREMFNLIAFDSNCKDKRK